jgi:hypothetical protein
MNPLPPDFASRGIVSDRFSVQLQPIDLVGDLIAPIGAAASGLVTRNGPRQANAAVAGDLYSAYRRRCRCKEPQTDRDKILIALREKPLKVFDIMKRVNIKHEDDCRSLLLKMRDDGAVKFDIHKGYWLAV